MGGLPRLLKRTGTLFQRLADRTKALWRGPAPASAPTTPAIDLQPRFDDLQPRCTGGAHRRSNIRRENMADNVKAILQKVDSMDRRLANLESGNNNLRKWITEGAISVLVCSSTEKTKEYFSQAKGFLKQLSHNTDELPEPVLSVIGPW